MGYICTRCGGTNVACEAIVNPNTGKIIDYFDGSFMHAICSNCENEVIISNIEEVKHEIDLRFHEFVERTGKEPEYVECQIVRKETGDELGKNGSGKSTLLNIISMYALCEKSMCSEMPTEALDFPPIFDDDDKVFDGIDISSDYAGKVFRLLPSTETNRDSVSKNISNFYLYVNSIQKSYGEKVVLSLESLFNLMFGQKDYTFPIQDLVEYKKKSNAFWIKRIDNLLKYYKRNRITLTESSFEYTVLMDEPDRNLDIDNIMQIYNVLSFHKPQTQIIAIIHNPALIYKLSKLDCVNFIEMTEGYLKDVVNFISETNK